METHRMQSPTPEAIRRLEDEIARLKAALAQMRRSAPPLPVTDYILTRADGLPVHLSQLFAGKRDLLVIHNMGRSCPYCTLWADGFNGVASHLQDRAGVALVSPDEPAELARFATARGWRIPVVSSRSTSFTSDLGFEPEAGKLWPGASGFRRTPDGVIVRTACATFGPGDDFSSTWHLFDLLAEGADGWQPRYAYQ
jgi:predicted dithiol-disulfide oxidoreductase (DUF899 family)